MVTERPCFDTHCHFGTDGETVRGQLERARAAGVVKVLAMGCDPDANRGAVLAARTAPDLALLSLGFDHSQADSLTPDAACAFLREFRDDARNPPLACVGEIGIDLHWKPGTEAAQTPLFEAQLGLADEWNLPVSIHTRESDEAILRSIDAVPQRNRKGMRGSIHCFTGSWELARELLDRNFLIGISGIVTFRNAEMLRDVARRLPADRILVETDSPYLAPVPMRGKRNEPAFVPHVVECLAKLRNVSCEEMARQTTQNAQACFVGG
ncbi:MAG: TatD family hydrolase [Kiritimatiellae bacterium]|nr:TatD family hydrolase [Kiritimatiellia bacterium]